MRSTILLPPSLATKRIEGLLKATLLLTKIIPKDGSHQTDLLLLRDTRLDPIICKLPHILIIALLQLRLGCPIPLLDIHVETAKYLLFSCRYYVESHSLILLS
jgi:hypothetical protein